jgi:uncharacterized protein (UPF0335 family)
MTARVAKDHLKAFVERIERMDEEIKALNDDKRDIYAEAKATGFDVPALKQVVSYRRKDPEKAKEGRAIFEMYLDIVQGGDGSPSRVHAREAAE